jgi:hypothetical protein
MQSSLKKKIKAGRLSIPASAPSLLHAWYCSAAWALGCIGSCALLRGWADENNAFEFGSQGQGQLAVLLLAVSLATGLFHVRAYKEFQLAYVLWVAEAWLIVVGLLRVGWVVAVLLLGLFVLMKDGPTDAGWR